MRGWCDQGLRIGDGEGWRREGEEDGSICYLSLG